MRPVLQGGRPGHPHWRGRAPGFPHATPTGALPAGSLCSAVSPNPEQRPEEERVFRATVNRQPCSLRGREGERRHEGRSHQCLWAREATAAGPGGLRRKTPLASLALSLPGVCSGPSPWKTPASRGQHLSAARHSQACQADDTSRGPLCTWSTDYGAHDDGKKARQLLAQDTHGPGLSHLSNPPPTPHGWTRASSGTQKPNCVLRRGWPGIFFFLSGWMDCERVNSPLSTS